LGKRHGRHKGQMRENKLENDHWQTLSAERFGQDHVVVEIMPSQGPSSFQLLPCRDSKSVQEASNCDWSVHIMKESINTRSS
jgi:hypothetical protein